ETGPFPPPKSRICGSLAAFPAKTAVSVPVSRSSAMPERKECFTPRRKGGNHPLSRRVGGRGLSRGCFCLFGEEHQPRLHQPRLWAESTLSPCPSPSEALGNGELTPCKLC